MKLPLLLAGLFFINTSFAQNVGIGTTTPTAPLSFGNNTGNKILLSGGGTSAHYGIGVQQGQLQFYTNQPGSAISFGTGRSDAFTERVRIINSGGDGMQVNGRIALKNGTSPLDLGYGSGLWLYKADNSALLGFMGVQNNQNLGFYGGPGAWGFVYDAINSRVGIGNNNPEFRLDLTGRMRIRNGGDGDAGIFFNNIANDALAAYMGLQDDSRVGLYGGYGAGWGFAMNTVTGAIALNGNYGTAGQIMKSNGAGANPSWISTADLFSPGGIVPPRMPRDQIMALTNPAEGAIVYNTTNKKPVYFDGANWRNFQGEFYKIGDNFRGGILAYILQPGDPGYSDGEFHGLIAAPTDQGLAKWGCSSLWLSATGSALGTGNQNTNYILANCAEAGIAARLCGDLVLNGYTDWYLPSIDELNKLYLNKTAIQILADNQNYWSSSVYFDAPLVWFQDFKTGVNGTTGATNQFHVRAIRSF